MEGEVLFYHDAPLVVRDCSEGAAVCHESILKDLRKLGWICQLDDWEPRGDALERRVRWAEYSGVKWWEMLKR